MSDTKSTISPEEARKKIEASLPKAPEPPKGPSDDEVTKARQILKDAAKAKDVAANFGPNLPGRKVFNLPKLPSQLGRISISTGTNGEPAKYLEGKTALSHDEYHEWLYLYETRIRQQRKDLYGEGIAQKIFMSTHLDGSGTTPMWNEGKPDPRYL